MDIPTEFQRVCRLAKLIPVESAKIPTWKEHTGHEAVELAGNKIIPFWFRDGERIYGQPVESKDIIAVMGAFDTPPIKPPQKEEKAVIPGGITPAQKRNELVIGSVSAIAGSYGISKELADLFFVKFDAMIYIKNPGLLYLAAKKGYGHILISDTWNDTTKDWEAECKIYPALTPTMVEAISKLAPTIQETALHAAMMPTNGLGRAGVTNIKMKTMLTFARELAQTRAQNRALRAYTGYGGCSAEELE